MIAAFIAFGFTVVFFLLHADESHSLVCLLCFTTVIVHLNSEEVHRIKRSFSAENQRERIRRPPWCTVDLGKKEEV